MLQHIQKHTNKHFILCAFNFSCSCFFPMWFDSIHTMRFPIAILFSDSNTKLIHCILIKIWTLRIFCPGNFRMSMNCYFVLLNSNESQWISSYLKLCGFRDEDTDWINEVKFEIYSDLNRLIQGFIESWLDVALWVKKIVKRTFSPL